MKLVHQITAAMLTTLLLVVALVAASLYVSVERGFARYVRGLEEARLEPAVARLTGHYTRERSWDALVRDPQRFRDMLRREEGDVPPPPPRADGQGREPPPPRANEAGDSPPPRPRANGPGDAPPPPPRAAPPERAKVDTDPLELPRRASLYDGARRRLIGEGSLDSDASRIPLVVDGATVGWLGVRAIPHLETALDVRYLEQVRQQLVVIALALLMTTLGLDGMRWNWVLYAIPGDVTSLAENSQGVGTAGLTSDGPELAYAPPCAQGPGPKTYTFTIYALSAALTLDMPANQVTGQVLTDAIGQLTVASSQRSACRPLDGSHEPRHPAVGGGAGVTGDVVADGFEIRNGAIRPEDRQRHARARRSRSCLFRPGQHFAHFAFSRARAFILRVTSA